MYTTSLNLASYIHTCTSVCIHPAYNTKQPSVLGLFCISVKGPLYFRVSLPYMPCKTVICRCMSVKYKQKRDFLLIARSEALEMTVKVAFAVYSKVNFDVYLIRKNAKS